MREAASGFLALLVLVSAISAAFALVAAWITHLAVGIKAISAGTVTLAYAVLLVVGTLLAPVGAVHGIGIWFGVW